MSTHLHIESTIVAVVDGQPVELSAVEEMVDRLRSGPFAALLPPESGAMGRQLRRWMVQLVTSMALVRRYADTHGLDLPGPPPDLSAGATVELGTMPTALLRTCPEAGAVYVAVTSTAAEQATTDSATRSYYDRNRADFEMPERTLVSAERRSGGGWSTPWWTRTNDLSATHRQAVCRTEVGVPTDFLTLGSDAVRYRTHERTPQLTRSYAEVRDEIAERLARPARRHAFVAWLEQERRAHVVLMPGFEHPADPAQPDNTHRH